MKVLLTARGSLARVIAHSGDPLTLQDDGDESRTIMKNGRILTAGDIKPGDTIEIDNKTATVVAGARPDGGNRKQRRYAAACRRKQR